MFICDLKLLQKTPIIYLIQSGIVWKAICDELDLHADICNMGSAFLATDYIMVHKPRGTICFLNETLAEFAVPMYRNHSSFSGPCSKNTE